MRGVRYANLNIENADKPRGRSLVDGEMKNADARTLLVEDVRQHSGGASVACRTVSGLLARVNMRDVWNVGHMDVAQRAVGEVPSRSGTLTFDAEEHDHYHAERDY